jgi:hypothetical protein
MDNLKTNEEEITLPAEMAAKAAELGIDPNEVIERVLGHPGEDDLATEATKPPANNSANKLRMAGQ